MEYATVRRLNDRPRRPPNAVPGVPERLLPDQRVLAQPDALHREKHIWGFRGLA